VGQRGWIFPGGRRGERDWENVLVVIEFSVDGVLAKIYLAFKFNSFMLQHPVIG